MRINKRTFLKTSAATVLIPFLPFQIKEDRTLTVNVIEEIADKYLPAKNKQNNANEELLNYQQLLHPARYTLTGQGITKESHLIALITKYLPKAMEKEARIVATYSSSPFHPPASHTAWRFRIEHQIYYMHCGLIRVCMEHARIDRKVNHA